MRDVLKRAGGLVVLLCALAVTVGGCGPLGESEDDKAADAAAAYRADVEEFAANVEDAAKKQYAEKDESDSKKPGDKRKDAKREGGAKKKGGKDKKGEKKEDKPTPLETALAEPPELAEFDSADPAYETAQALAERLGPMADELGVLAKIDQGREYRLNLEIETKEYDFGADVISRSTDYLFDPNVDVSVFGTDEQLAGLAKQAIEKEVRAWPEYRKRIARVKTPYKISDSYKQFELEGIDYEIALFREYKKHLEQVPGNAAQLAYYDDIWPDEDPIRLGATGTFNSLGNPYFKSLGEGERIVRSMTRDLSELATAESVDENSPSVGDAYRDAIVDGFVPTREKYKYVGAQANYRAWMLFRIKQLEDTPDEVYEAAQKTIYLELVDDSRNTYNTFLALLAGYQDSSVIGARDVAGLRAYVKLANQELSGIYPPLLDEARQSYLRALDSIDLSLYPVAYGKIGGDIDALEDAFDARDKAQRQFDEAGKKIRIALRQGATVADSTKRSRKALEDAIAATEPAASAAAAEELTEAAAAAEAEIADDAKKKASEEEPAE